MLPTKHERILKLRLEMAHLNDAMNAEILRVRQSGLPENAIRRATEEITTKFTPRIRGAAKQLNALAFTD